MIVDGSTVACQTWIEGTFVRPFTQSPAGHLEPNGARVVAESRVIGDLMNMFMFDDAGRLVEEHVRANNRNFLRQLGVAQGA